MAKLRVTRKAYTRKGGTRVKKTSFLIKDRGKPGRTPKAKRWYAPSTEMGWRKDQSPTTRRRLALKAHKGSHLSAGRSLQALSNVTTDKTTKTRAAQDARYFFSQHKKRQ